MPFPSSFQIWAPGRQLQLDSFWILLDSFWLAWSLTVTFLSWVPHILIQLVYTTKQSLVGAVKSCHWWLGKDMLSNNFHATGRGVVRPLHSSNTSAQTASRPKGQALGAISIIPSLAFIAVQSQEFSTLVPTQRSPHRDLKSTWQGLYRVVVGSWKLGRSFSSQSRAWAGEFPFLTNFYLILA